MSEPDTSLLNLLSRRLASSEECRNNLFAEIERLRALLKELQAYSVGDPKPRHTWYYDRIETALNQQSTTKEKP